MFSQKQQTESERLDRLGREALRAASMSEAEAEAVAEAEDLYSRLRQRIAATARQRVDDTRPARGWWSSLHRLSAWRRPLWPLAAAVALLILSAVIVPRWLQMSAPESSQITTDPPSPPVRPTVRPLASEPTPTVQSQGGEKSAISVMQASQSKPERRSPRSRNGRVNVVETESATEFIPLMYSDAAAMENSRVVRIKVPRATLVSFGLPMNAERAGELVKAEVVLGDDGLARAIRFIY